MTAATALTRVVVLGGHRGHETMEARLPGKLRMERGGDDVPLADRDDPAVRQLGQDVDTRSHDADDGRPDEHAVDRLIAEDRHVQIRLE